MFFVHLRPFTCLGIVCAAGLTWCLPSLNAQEAGMALAERRAIKQYQDTKFPEEQKKIRAAAGFDVPLEVKWEAIARPGDAASYQEDGYWTNIYFEPLTAALKDIAKDEMGAKVLKEKLKKIVVTYDAKAEAAGSEYTKRVSFENGTLTLTFVPYTNTDDIAERGKVIATVLEAKL